MGRNTMRSDSGEMVETAECTKCGRRENINLLDGGGPEFGKAENALECIACYGREWSPWAVADLKRSVCHGLADLYERYSEAHLRGDTDAAQSSASKAEGRADD